MLKHSKMKVCVSANNQSSRSVAGLDDILTFKWQFSMNGEEVSAEAFKKLVEEKREFVRIGANWFRIDAEWLDEINEEIITNGIDVVQTHGHPMLSDAHVTVLGRTVS